MMKINKRATHRKQMTRSLNKLSDIRLSSTQHVGRMMSWELSGQLLLTFLTLIDHYSPRYAVTQTQPPWGRFAINHRLIIVFNCDYDSCDGTTRASLPVTAERVGEKTDIHSGGRKEEPRATCVICSERQTPTS